MAYRHQSYRPPTATGSAPVVVNLLIANLVAFLIPQFFSGGTNLFLYYGALWPLGTPDYLLETGQVAPFGAWQLVTYAFLHGGFYHLLFNMLGLFIFGTDCERTWGSHRFLFYYAVCAIGAGLVQLLVGSLHVYNNGTPYPTVGASGGVYGVMLAYAWLFPDRSISLLFPPVTLPARTFVIIMAVLTLFNGLGGFMPGIAHFAHFGGMAFGLLVLLYWRGKLPFKPGEII